MKQELQFMGYGYVAAVLLLVTASVTAASLPVDVTPRVSLLAPDPEPTPWDPYPATVVYPYSATQFLQASRFPSSRVYSPQVTRPMVKLPAIRNWPAPQTRHRTTIGTPVPMPHVPATATASVAYSRQPPRYPVPAIAPGYYPGAATQR